MQIPPERLLGTPGMSSPKYQSTELVADFLDEPVPITSPTKATGRSLIAHLLRSAPLGQCCRDLQALRPSRVILYMARACRGMSGRDQASCAGDRSSVLVSPVTLNTTALMLSGTASLLVNHSASAQLCITPLASALPASAFAATSWNASKTKMVDLQAAQRPARKAPGCLVSRPVWRRCSHRACCPSKATAACGVDHWRRGFA